MRTVSDAEHARRLTAYHASTNDSDAAAGLGIQAVTFRQWRKAQGLPAKQSGKPKRPNGTVKPARIPARSVALALALIEQKRMEELRAILPR